MKSAREPGFDSAEDLRQAGMRLEVIRYLAIGIFVLIVGRLWFLQVMNSSVFAERAEQNRTRVLAIPAARARAAARRRDARARSVVGGLSADPQRRSD